MTGRDRAALVLIVVLAPRRRPRALLPPVRGRASGADHHDGRHLDQRQASPVRLVRDARDHSVFPDRRLVRGLGFATALLSPTCDRGAAGTTPPLIQQEIDMHDVDGVNAGYARLLLDEYLENPEAVPPEWRALFESGDSRCRRDPARARPPARAAAARRRRRRDGERPDGGRAAVAAPPSRDRSSTPSCSAGSRPRWRSSRPTACTAISRPGSTRSAPSRSAIPRSTRCGSSRS